MECFPNSVGLVQFRNVMQLLIKEQKRMKKVLMRNKLLVATDLSQSILFNTIDCSVTDWNAGVLVDPGQKAGRTHVSVRMRSSATAQASRSGERNNTDLRADAALGDGQRTAGVAATHALDALVAARAHNGRNDDATTGEHAGAFFVGNDAYVNPTEQILQSTAVGNRSPSGNGGQNTGERNSGLGTSRQTHGAHSIGIAQRDRCRRVHQGDVIVQVLAIEIRMVNHASRCTCHAAGGDVIAAETHCDLGERLGAMSGSQNPAVGDDRSTARGDVESAIDAQQNLVRELSLAGSVAIDNALVDLILESISLEDGQGFAERLDLAFANDLCNY